MPLKGIKMRRRIIYSLITLFGIAVLQLFSHTTTYAESATQVVTVSPASAQLSVDPGGSVSKDITILNSGDDTYTVALSTAPYYVTGLQYDPHFTQLPGTRNASEWITLDTETAELTSNQTIHVKYTVTVPADTPPGGYYAVIFTETAQDAVSGGIVPKKRVGSLVYITVNGEVQKTGSATGKAVPLFSLSKINPLSIRVANSGGVHFSSKVTFSVTDITGKEVYATDIERIILPSTEREITADWTTASAAGIYTVHRKATVADELVTLDDQTVVVVTPWFLLFLGIFLLSIIVLITTRLRQRKRNKRD
jgi:hypothetical protein